MKIVTKKEKDNMLVDICSGCRNKEQICKCTTENIFKVYTSDIYIKKALRVIIQEGVVSDLSGKEIISNINTYIKENSEVEVKRNVITNEFKFIYKSKSK